MQRHLRIHRGQTPAGFTLIETLIAMSIFLVVLFAVYTVYDVGEANYQRGTRKWDVQSGARVALERMAREIRMAGYAAPTKVTDPVVIATNDTISIHADLDGTGAKYVTYSRRDCNGNLGTTLFRNVSSTTFCGGDAFIDGVSGLSFSYYELNNVPVPLPASAPYQPAPPYQLDSQGAVTGSGVPSVPAAGGERDRVRQVKISLTIQQAANGMPVRFTATTDVALRNLMP